MKPFSDNVIFLDTEFSTLNPYEGEILSIGLVKMNGEELYLELEHDGPVSDWVKEHILPMLTGKKISRDVAKRMIKEFVAGGVNPEMGSRPYAVSYVNQYDAIYLYKLFQGDEHPFHWLPIDFASFLFCSGMNPEKLLVYGGVVHHALDDARLLRENYLKFFKEKK